VIQASVQSIKRKIQEKKIGIMQAILAAAA